MTLTIEIPNDVFEKIEAKAAQSGTTPQQVLAELAESNFNGATKTAFRPSADYVLQKNAELLRRLA